MNLSRLKDEKFFGVIMALKNNPKRPVFLEYRTPHGRNPQFCCYKDAPCNTHRTVLNNLARMFTGEIEADPKNLEIGIANKEYEGRGEKTK
jgi:hypothetical protein